MRTGIARPLVDGRLAELVHKIPPPSEGPRFRQNRVRPPGNADNRRLASDGHLHVVARDPYLILGFRLARRWTFYGT